MERLYVEFMCGENDPRERLVSNVSHLSYGNTPLSESLRLIPYRDTDGSMGYCGILDVSFIEPSWEHQYVVGGLASIPFENGDSIRVENAVDIAARWRVRDEANQDEGSARVNLFPSAFPAVFDIRDFSRMTFAISQASRTLPNGDELCNLHIFEGSKLVLTVENVRRDSVQVQGSYAAAAEMTFLTYEGGRYKSCSFSNRTVTVKSIGSKCAWDKYRDFRRSRDRRYARNLAAKALENGFVDYHYSLGPKPSTRIMHHLLCKKYEPMLLPTVLGDTDTQHYRVRIDVNDLETIGIIHYKNQAETISVYGIPLKHYVHHLEEAPLSIVLGERGINATTDCVEKTDQAKKYLEAFGDKRSKRLLAELRSAEEPIGSLFFRFLCEKLDPELRKLGRKPQPDEAETLARPYKEKWDAAKAELQEIERARGKEAGHRRDEAPVVEALLPGEPSMYSRRTLDESITSSLALSKTIHSALREDFGCETIGDLFHVNVDDFLKTRGLGKGSVSKVREEFRSYLENTAATAQGLLKKKSLAGEPATYAKPVLEAPLAESLKLTERIHGILREDFGCETIGDLFHINVDDFLKTRGLGKGAAQRVRDDLWAFLAGSERLTPVTGKKAGVTEDATSLAFKNRDRKASTKKPRRKTNAKMTELEKRVLCWAAEHEHDRYFYENIVRCLADNPNAPEWVLEHIHSNYIHGETPRNLARNESTPPEIIDRLAFDHLHDLEWIERDATGTVFDKSPIVTLLRYDHPALSEDLLMRLVPEISKRAPKLLASLVMCSAFPEKLLNELANHLLKYPLTRNELTEAEVETISLLVDPASWPYVKGGLARNPKTKEMALVVLSADSDWRTRAYCAGNPKTPEFILRDFARRGDDSPQVVSRARTNEGLASDFLDELAEKLIQDGGDDALEVGANPSASPKLLRKLSKVGISHNMLKNPRTPLGVLEKAVDEIDVELIFAHLAFSPNCPDELLLKAWDKGPSIWAINWHREAPIELIRSERLSSQVVEIIARRYLGRTNPYEASLGLGEPFSVDDDLDCWGTIPVTQWRTQTELFSTSFRYKIRRRLDYVNWKSSESSYLLCNDMPPDGSIENPVAEIKPFCSPARGKVFDRCVERLGSRLLGYGFKVRQVVSNGSTISCTVIRCDKAGFIEEHVIAITRLEDEDGSVSDNENIVVALLECLSVLESHERNHFDDVFSFYGYAVKELSWGQESVSHDEMFNIRKETFEDCTFVDARARITCPCRYANEDGLTMEECGKRCNYGLSYNMARYNSKYDPDISLKLSIVSKSREAANKLGDEHDLKILVAQTDRRCCGISLGDESANLYLDKLTSSDELRFFCLLYTIAHLAEESGIFSSLWGALHSLGARSTLESWIEEDDDDLYYYHIDVRGLL